MRAMRRTLALALSLGCVAALSPASPVEAHRGLRPSALVESAQGAAPASTAPSAATAVPARPGDPAATATPVPAPRGATTPGIPASSWALAAALGAALLAMGRRPRPVMAALLVVVLAVFVFESG